MSRPPLQVADIFRQYGERFLNEYPTATEQRRVLEDIQRCRTAELGGHAERCSLCGHQEISYNSCRNSHCPKCQAQARARWLEARQEDLLPVEYFHVVFTMPEEIRLIALRNKRAVYGILFRAAAETLLEVARDPRHLGAEIGFFGILHTWGQNIAHHPHLHFVVPGGGLSADRSKWISSPKGFFLPVAVLRIVFRGKFLDLLERAFRSGKLSLRGSLRSLAEAAAFKALLQKASRHQWVVYSKPPFGSATHVLKYLSRYTHRVAISNQRLVSMKGGKVTFRWKDYADRSKKKLMSLNACEFIRRFLLHVLPPGFHRIRYFGFLSARRRKESLEICRKALTSPNVDKSVEASDLPEREDQLKRCPMCKEGFMIPIEEPLYPFAASHKTRQPPEPINTS